MGLIIVFVLVGGLLIFLKVKVNNKIEKIISSNQKHRFKYLDAFYTRGNTTQTGSGPQFYYVLEDTDTNKTYVVDKALFKNAFCMALGNDDFHLYKKKTKKRIELYESGSFWIDKALDNFYQRDGMFVTLDGGKYVYSKYESKVVVSGYGNDDENILLLYNTNPNYDVSLLDNAIFVTGVIEFDIDNINSWGDAWK